MDDLKELFDFLNQPEASPSRGRPAAVEAGGFLRKLVYQLATKRSLSKSDLKKFEALVKDASHDLELKGDGIRFQWAWKNEGAVQPLKKMTRIAEWLILNGDLLRIKKCEGEGCDLVFYDMSKNRSRRWCEMNHCGMLLKSRRYYDIHRRADTKR